MYFGATWPKLWVGLGLLGISIKAEVDMVLPCVLRAQMVTVPVNYSCPLIDLSKDIDAWPVEQVRQVGFQRKSLQFWMEIGFKTEQTHF